MKILILLSLIPLVFGIKCWNCRSKYDPHCADSMNNSTVSLVDCYFINRVDGLSNTGPAVCRKMKEKVNGEWYYVRDCGFLNGTMLGCHMDFNGVETCTCDNKDGCNSSVLLKPINYLLSIICIYTFFS